MSLERDGLEGREGGEDGEEGGGVRPGEESVQRVYGEAPEGACARAVEGDARNAAADVECLEARCAVAAEERGEVPCVGVERIGERAWGRSGAVEEGAAEGEGAQHGRRGGEQADHGARERPDATELEVLDTV